MALTLYSFWAATAPYRVRIGLALKGLDFDIVPVDLRAGDQHGEAYRARNPQGLAPALDTGSGDLLTQSLAILEWLEDTHPEPPLLPPDALGRARVDGQLGGGPAPVVGLEVLKHQGLGAPGWFLGWAASKAGWPAAWSATAFRAGQRFMSRS